MGPSWQVPGSAPGRLLENSASLLRPQDQVYAAIIGGWRDQQLARNLNTSTDLRTRTLRSIPDGTVFRAPAADGTCEGS